MGYGDVGSLTARQGSSLCSLRSTDPKFQCCDNVDLQCYGCNQNLLAQGEKCDDQTVSASATDKRDCFCDQSCIIFSDCCDDHPITCQRKGIRPVSFQMAGIELSKVKSNQIQISKNFLDSIFLARFSRIFTVFGYFCLVLTDKPALRLSVLVRIYRYIG